MIIELELRLQDAASEVALDVLRSVNLFMTLTSCLQLSIYYYHHRQLTVLARSTHDRRSWCIAVLEFVVLIVGVIPPRVEGEFTNPKLHAQYGRYYQVSRE